MLEEFNLDAFIAVETWANYQIADYKGYELF